MLVDASGNKKGLVKLSKALEAAKESSLDLVQVSPSNSNPIVCKLLDYGKHLFDKKDKTKISVRFRGREILNSNMGLNLLNKLKLELEDIAQVDQEPSLEGRQLLMVLSPLSKKR